MYIVGWFKSSANVSPGSANSAMILCGVGKGELGYAFQVGVGPGNGKTEFRVNGYGDEYDWKTGIDAAPYFDGNWHYIVINYDNVSKTTSLYIDAVKKAQTNSYTFRITSGSQMVIGAEIDKAGWNFKGIFDNVFFGAGTMPEVDIQQYYNLTKSSYYNRDLYAFYANFNYPSGIPDNNFAYDYSMNGNYATCFTIPFQAGVDRLSCGGASGLFGMQSSEEYVRSDIK